MSDASSTQAIPKPARPAALGARAVLAIPDYRRIAAAQFISDFGDALTLLATLLVVNQLTGSLGAIAFMAIVVAIPQATIGIVAGVWVDRLEPRTVMLVSDLVRALLVLGLVLVQTADMVWLLFLLGFLEAAVSTFFAPARMTLVSVVVPRNGLLAANSVSQGGRVIATVLGTGAAGLLVPLAHSGWPAFVVDSATFILSFLLILGVRARRPARGEVGDASGAASSVIAELRGGIRAVTGNPALIAAVIAGAIVMLGIGAVNVLFVPLLVNDLGVSPAWFGAIDAAQTAGMILAAGLLATRLAGVPPSWIVSVAMFALAVFVALVSAVTGILQVVVLLFLVGWIVTPMQASFATIVQTESAPEVRGRVAALMNSAVTTASILSMAFAGAVGVLVGARTVFLLCAGVIAVGAVVATVLFHRGQAHPSASERESPPAALTPAVD